ncbi:MAG: hypothetical protein ACK4OI_05935, partial [Rhizobium oryzihabitans]
MALQSVQILTFGLSGGRNANLIDVSKKLRLGDIGLCPHPDRGAEASRYNIRECYFSRLQTADNAPSSKLCQQKAPRRALLKLLIFMKKTGAGEGIRTLDPNLGKV